MSEIFFFWVSLFEAKTKEGPFLLHSKQVVIKGFQVDELVIFFEFFFSKKMVVPGLFFMVSLDPLKVRFGEIRKNRREDFLP